MYKRQPYIGAGTNLAGALQFVKVADGLVKFIVISDGQPDLSLIHISEPTRPY